MRKRDTGLSTRSVHGGEEEPSFARAIHGPVFHTVSFGYPDVDEWLDVAQGRASGHVYSRNTNPTVDVFEEKIRLLEGGEAATSAATGMAAISSCLYALLKPGRRLVASRDVYGGTVRLLTEFLPHIGVDVALVPARTDLLVQTLDAPADVVYLETPTNPMLHVLDLERVVRAAHHQGALVVVDNTVATPIHQAPLSLGVDLVVHSATKYLGGHGDVLGGVVVGKRNLVERIFAYREIHGAALHADAADRLIRGMKTLELRVTRQSDNAQHIAEFLNEHRKVRKVYYPGLPSHPDHAIAARQMRGFGGLLSLSLGDDFAAVRRFCSGLRLAHNAASLGAVETMIGLPCTASHVECTPEQRAELGIPEGLVRLSVGIEDVEDLLDDLDNALQGV